MLFQLTTIEANNLELKNEVLTKIKNGIPQWMLNQISKDLILVPQSGISRQLIIDTLNQDSMCLALFAIKNGKIDVTYNQKLAIEIQQDACNPIVAILTELNDYISLPDIEFVYCMDDAPFSWYRIVEFKEYSNSTKYHAPVFTACKHINDANCLLIPDFHTLKSIANNVIQSIASGNTKYPWSSKINKAFWRGATTGGLYRLHNFTQFPRVKLAKLSIDFPEHIDAKFNYLWALDGETQNKLHELQYTGDTASIEDHIHYKYQILIDGNSASWPRAYWQYQCNSVVFKQDSNFIVWHNDLFKPWIHYIPFEQDCANLIEKINWAINNDDAVEKIAQASNKTANECLQYSDILVYFYAVITEYAKLLVYNN